MSNSYMQYGFVDYLGNVWSDNQVDTYNRYNAQVFKREAVPHDKGSLHCKELEFYKDQRHKQFIQTVDINSKPKQKLIPTYKTILRFKKYCVKKQLPLSAVNDSLRKVFRKRGGQWFSSNLNWYK